MCKNYFLKLKKKTKKKILTKFKVRVHTEKVLALKFFSFQTLYLVYASMKHYFQLCLQINTELSTLESDAKKDL